MRYFLKQQSKAELPCLFDCKNMPSPPPRCDSPLLPFCEGRKQNKRHLLPGSTLSTLGPLHNPRKGFKFAARARCDTLKRRGGKKENQNKWLKSNVPLYSFTHDGSRSTHDHTLEHPVDSSGRRAAHCSFPPSPSPSLSLSLSLTLASSLPAHLLQPPPPASLFFHRSPHLLFLCQTKCTHPLILSAHYFIYLFIFLHFPPPTHTLCSVKTNIIRRYY